MNPGIKINGVYYRAMLLKQEMLPDIRVISRNFSFFSRTIRWPIGPMRRSCYCSERFQHSLLPICGLPTAPTSTLLTTRCGVQCRTMFIGQRCEMLMIWSSIWLTYGKAPSTMQTTSGVHNFVPVSMRSGNKSSVRQRSVRSMLPRKRI